MHYLYYNPQKGAKLLADLYVASEENILMYV